jgi:hypothetical protein
MAIVEKFLASLQIGGSNQRLGSTTFRVSPADARAYEAAADQAARDATKVGLLLTSMLNISIAKSTNIYKKYGLESDFINGSFAYAPKDGDVYKSQALKVTYQTTNAGLPVIESQPFYFRRTDYVMAPNGTSILLTGGDNPDIEDFIAQLIDTGLSSYGTAITAVDSITVNDA